MMGFAIIGCGAIAHMHASSVNELDTADLKAVVDVDEKRAGQFAQKYQCGYYTSNYKDLLVRKDINTVSICTPSGLREQIVLDCAAAGKNIIVEKPIEIRADRIDRIVSACRENNVKLACIYNTRYKESHMLIKEAVDKGRFGKLINGNAYVRWYRDPEYYSSSSWKGTWAFDGGGALMNQGIHTIDLLQWYMGEVESVFAYAGTLLHTGIEVEDTATAVLKFKNGAIGVIVGGTSIYPGSPSKLEITGDKGTAEVSEGKIDEWAFKDKDEIDARAEAYMHEIVEGNRASDPMAFSNEYHKKQIREIIRDINNGNEPLVNGEEAGKAVRLILSIYESVRTGREVRV